MIAIYLKKTTILIIAFSLFVACKHDKEQTIDSKYPYAIDRLISESCAVVGCHNNESYQAAANLNLTTWDNMFEGTGRKSVVIPYGADHSILFYSINTFDDLGPKLSPTMPVSAHPFSRTEVLEIMKWINAGAPDKNGRVKFSDNPSRKKIYVANQGCDLVSIYDATSKLIMRVVNIGNSSAIEAAHDMYMSPDQSHWYVSFFASSKIEKYDSSTDVKIAELDLGDQSWHSMSISPNSKYAIASHWGSSGKIALIDLTSFTVRKMYQGSGLFSFPHGSAFSSDSKSFYVVSQNGNFIYKVDISNPDNPDINEIVLQPGTSALTYGIYKPYEVDFSPDFSNYFVTCQGTNEVRVFNSSNDAFVKAIQLPGVPQLMSFSEKYKLLFVTCMEDSANVSTESNVSVIDLNTLSLIKNIKSGYQPRGLVVDDNNGVVFVANRNISPVGWTPHHTTSCGGKNGYISFIDIPALELIPGWKSEVSVDPYTVIIRN